MYHRQGRWQDAEAAYRASLAIKKAANDRFGEGLALNNLGEALLHLGKREEAERCLCQSLEIRREFHDRPGEGETLRNLAELYASRGALPDALEAARLAVDVLEKTEDTAGLRRSRDLLTRLQHAPGV